MTHCRVEQDEIDFDGGERIGSIFDMSSSVDDFDENRDEAIERNSSFKSLAEKESEHAVEMHRAETKIRIAIAREALK